MISTSIKFQTTLKRRIKITGTGKLKYFNRSRVKSFSFSYPKKKIKTMFKNKSRVITSKLRHHKHFGALVKK